MSVRSGADGDEELPIPETLVARDDPLDEAVAGFKRAGARVPPSVSAVWRADMLVLCGDSLRHVGDASAARAAFLHAATLSADPALLARVALGYADQGADLGI